MFEPVKLQLLCHYFLFVYVGIHSESCLAPLLRDPRSEYEMLPSGCNVGKEVGYVPPQHQTTIIPLASSLMDGLDHCLSDMGAFTGRSFRVGWGPGWKLVHTGSLLTPSVDEDNDAGGLNMVIVNEPPPAFLCMGSLAAEPKSAPSAECPR